MTSEETDAIKKSIQNKLRACNGWGMKAEFSYEECCILSWYIRTHETLLSIADRACKRLGIALTYILSLWRVHHGGATYNMVTYPLPDGELFKFEYNRSLDVVASSQETIKLINGGRLPDDTTIVKMCLWW